MRNADGRSRKEEGDMLKNKRLKQLVIMFSTITGVSETEAEKIIIHTETGQAVLDNDETVIYEQQTENLYCIAEELKNNSQYVKLAEQLSDEKIVKVMKDLKNLLEAEEHTCIIKVSAGDVSSYNKRLKQKQKEVLKIKAQNERNHRRIEHAD